MLVHSIHCWKLLRVLQMAQRCIQACAQFTSETNFKKVKTVSRQLAAAETVAAHTFDSESPDTVKALLP